MIGACVVAASSVAIPASPSRIAVSEPKPQRKDLRKQHSVAIPTNKVGVNTPPGAPDPLLASTASSLQIKTPAITDSSGGDCKTPEPRYSHSPYFRRQQRQQPDDQTTQRQLPRRRV